MESKYWNIDQEEVTKNDPGRTFEAYEIRFMNRGQTAVRIDESEYLEPGESYIEGSLSSPIPLKHKYKFKFFPVDTPPQLKAFKVFAGNKLFVRMFKKKDA